jgi:hypothetical protein
MKLGMYIMASEPKPKLHRPLPSICVSICVYPVVARQRLDKNVSATINTDAAIEEMLDAFFSMRSVSYQETQAISY